MSRPVVYLCKGKHCAAAKKDREAVRKAVRSLAEVKEVKCQKICEPPVVGVSTANGELWLAPLNTPKARRRLQELLETGKLRKALKKRRQKARG